MTDTQIKSNRKLALSNSKFLFTLVSIFMGLLIGAIVIGISGYNPLEAYGALVSGVFKTPRNIGWAVVYSTPIILTGLGVCFAFKTGLFNMGAEGQYIVGTIVGFMVAYALPLPPIIHPIVAIILAMAAGALYGAIAGFIKAKFGIHEVISTIMLNWIAFYFQNFIAYKYQKPNAFSTFDILDSAKVTLFKNSYKNFGPFFSKFFKAPVHLGIILGILAIIAVWYILNKTVLGYELKAVGLNREASEYGGINSGNKIIQSMAISGAICALAGACQVLGYTYSLSVLSAMDNYGFDGLAVALLASNNPIAVIFSGLFFGSLKYAGSNLQRVLGVPTELINIIIGTIILFTAVPLIFRIIKARRKMKKAEKNAKLESDKFVEEKVNKETKKASQTEEKILVKEDQTDKIPIKDPNEDFDNKESNNNPNIINETGEEIKVRKVESEEE